MKEPLQARRVTVYVLLFALIALLYLLVRIAGIQQHPKWIQGAMALLLLGELAYLIVRKKQNLLSERQLVILLVSAGMIMRIGYMLYTGCTLRSHDLNVLSEGAQNYTGGHAAYILTLLSTGHLPDSNWGQFYQQPLFYILGSLVSAVINGILSCKDLFYLVDAAKIISCFASCGILLLTDRLCEVCSLKGTSRMLTLSVVAFTPAFYLTGGRVNSDALAAFFMVLALLYTLLWYKTPSWRYTIALAVMYGCGMMTKISCAVMAVFTAFLFAVKLVQAVREHAACALLGKYAVFASISFPLGLWYSLRNYVLFGQSPAYVAAVSPNSPLYTGAYPLIERLFAIDVANLMRTPYANPYTDYNAPVYYVKSAMFGEFSYTVPEWIPWLLLLSAVLLSVMTLLCLFGQLFQKHRTFPDMFLAAVFVLYYVSVLLFYLNAPFGCSMDFRYMIFLTIPAAIFIGKGYLRSTSSLMRKMMVGYVGAYGAFSCLMYLLV